MSDHVVINEIDVFDDAAMNAGFEVARASHLAEEPTDPFITAPEVIARARATDRAMSSDYWVLMVDGLPAGAAQLELYLRDNPELAEVDVAIAPEHQGRGLGRLLLEHVLGAVAGAGRHQVILAANQPADGSTSRTMKFLAAAGASNALGEMRRFLDLRGLDAAELAHRRAQAESKAVGYELVSWTGSCPEDLIEDYAALVARMSTDAPVGDLSIEPEVWDAQRVRGQEAIIVAQGRTAYVMAARVGADGPLVAFTDAVVTRHDPVNAFQWNTLVLREHRGHRLGMLVKAANLARLLSEAPAAQRLHTWNALDNPHMVAINEELGFRPAVVEGIWRLDLPVGGDEDHSGEHPRL